MHAVPIKTETFLWFDLKYYKNANRKILCIIQNIFKLCAIFKSLFNLFIAKIVCKVLNTPNHYIHIVG